MWQWFVKGGAIMYPLLLCSVLALGIILERLWSYPPLLRRGREVLQTGLPPGEQEKAAAQLVRSLQQGLPILDTIVTIAPMLGLLGTITGVIHSFELLGRGVMELNKANLGAGLAEALITTEAGLFIAIPTLVVVNYLRQRIEVFVDWFNTRLAGEEEGSPC